MKYPVRHLKVFVIASMGNDSDSFFSLQVAEAIEHIVTRQDFRYGTFDNWAQHCIGDVGVRIGFVQWHWPPLWVWALGFKIERWKKLIRGEKK